MKLAKREIIILAFAAVLLVGVGVSAAMRPVPADAEPFHQYMREVADRIPKQIGAWTGYDTPMPPAAVKLLKPNVLRGLDFENTLTGEHVSLLVVQTRDARDMVGHYPPVCYPSHGWTMVSETPRDWQVGDRTISGTEYAISYEAADSKKKQVIANFLIMPDGRIMRDMKGVKHAAADYRKHFFGAGQVQVVMSGYIEQERRDQIIVELLGANLELIDALGSAGRWTDAPTP